MQNSTIRAWYDYLQTARAGAAGQEAELFMELPSTPLARLAAKECTLALAASDGCHPPACAACAGRAVVCRHDQQKPVRKSNRGGVKARYILTLPRFLHARRMEEYLAL